MPDSTLEAPRFACLDWWQRILRGDMPMADVPLNPEKAAKALAFFNRLRLPDVAGNPPLSEACGEWFRDILCAFLASEDPTTKQRLVWELLCMVPKKNSKTTYVAALGLTALFMEEAPNRQMLVVAPSQNISERCFEQAQGMIRLDPRLDAIFKVQDHLKCITRRKTGTKLEVKTFDTSIVTGEIPVLTIIDELHELGKKSKAASVMQQIRGGGITMQGGQVLMITTQSDEQPAGIWKTELEKARKIRDGKGGSAPILLPVLFEFPWELQRNQEFWRNQRNWAGIQPNLGRSIDPERLIADYENNGRATPEAERIWASQHLNIEIGIGLKTDAWPGAEFWAEAEDPDLTLDALIERSEVIVVGADGGGLDDLFGANALGREKVTKTWLSWSHAWCHQIVLKRRPSIASRLEGFAVDDELTIIDDEFEDISESVELVEEVEQLLLPKDVAGFVKLIARIKESGKLAAVALDVEGPYGELVDALALIDVTAENGLIVGVGQGYRLMNALKATERKVANGTMKHCPSGAMDWNIGNIKIEPTATAIRATKQNAGDAKIDMAMAMFDAASVMLTNPEAGRSVFDEIADQATADAGAEEPQTDDVDMAILADTRHPQWQEMRERYERRFAMADEEF